MIAFCILVIIVGLISENNILQACAVLAFLWIMACIINYFIIPYTAVMLLN